MVEDILITIGVTANLALAAGMVISRITTSRFWPPGERDWRWWTYVLLSGIATIALLGVAYLDWNTFVLPRPETLFTGGTIVAVGVAGFIAATLDLGADESSGLDGELRTGGYYRYTRNPQLVVLLIIVAGAVLVANSQAVLVIAAAMAVWFVSMPFAEEPWLRQQYGDEYETYYRKVPRFVGVHTVRAILGNVE